jgi:hypothetical protein
MYRSKVLFIMLIVTILIGFSTFLSAQTRQIPLSNASSGARLTQNHQYGFEVEFRASELKIEEKQTRGGTYDEVSINGYGFTGRIGEPQLPVISRMIAVPVGASVSYEVISRSQRTLNRSDSRLQHRIIPAQASISKSEDPDKAPFEVKENAYNRNSLSSNELFTVTDAGYMRGVRLFQIEFEPVSYNPVSGELVVNYDVTIQVRFDNPDFIATEQLLAKTASFEFEQLYSKTIFNWNNDRPSLVRYPTKLLILTPPNYVSTLAPYIEWKTQRGFQVITTTVGTGGTVTNSTTAIKTYMQNMWNASTTENPMPTYLLIVGDTSTSGDNIIANTGESSTAHVTDLTYVRLNGTDYLPELYYGRFSVSSATELTNIINKTVTFEKTAMPDLSYLGNVVMIAGADASYAPTYGNGQINYGTTHYFNTTNGITSDTYLYPASATSDAQIIANANNGRGYMNYTAHGSETSWADPTFSVSDVNAMTNTGKYGFMVGNCCITNKFNYASGPCFGESIIRKANAGGVAYIGGTNNTYWDEDYWWGIGYKTPIQAAAHPYNASTLGAYDAMFHTHGEALADWAQTVGETNYMGNMAVQQSTSTRKPYYWEIYSIMGDPSLMPYYGVPTTNVATYPATILIGATSINVTATPQSRVALTMGGVIYGTGIVGTSGSLTLPITPFSTVGTAKLVITRQNKITIQADVTIAPNTGPYMTVSAANYADSNNNIAEYNEAGRFNVTFLNVGSVTATNTVATLTCTTPGISITDGTETIASLAAGGSTTINNAYTFNIANNIANGTPAAFTITMVSGANTWTHNFSQVINAPALAFGNMTIQDTSGNNNGRLDPGETVTVIMPLNNTGAASSPSGNATLSCSTPGITVVNGNASFAAITAGGAASLSFTITASSGMTVGTVASLVFNATAGAYTANKTETTAVGLILEDFETGNFNSFPWTFSGNLPWVIDNTNAQTGAYSARSGVITHSQTSTMQTVRILTTGGDISFWYKVSSESGYDFLKFYVDGTVVSSWSGTVDWTQYTYALSAGTRTLKWEYMKDGSVDTGSDCAWVDNIIFPASTSPSVYNPPQNLVGIPGNGQVTLNWQAPVSGTPTGYKIYRNASLLTTVTGLTHNDTSVVNETTYNYYVRAAYSGGDSDPSNTVTVTPTAQTVLEAILGTGTTSTTTTTAAPINVYYQSLHGQSVYTAAELNALGIIGPLNITQIGFNITGLPSLTMPNYIIRMKHTTATDASAWISADGMTAVWTSASYLPTETGYNMLVLSTPFLWNGTDNIIIDTAFGLIGSYTSTGTVQYTTVTNGYRYVRSDTADQTSIFTGGSTATNRPNVKMVFTTVTSNPQFTVSPTSHDFGATVINTIKTRTFTVANTGGGTLTITGASITGSGMYTIQTPPTFPINLAAGQSTTITVRYLPTAVGNHTGNLVITDNLAARASHSVALTGSCYDPTITAFPWVETFTTWPPADWSLSGGTQNWAHYTAVPCAYANLWGWQVPNNAVLITPPLRPTGPVAFSFKWSHAYNATYPNDAMRVSYSTDMANWTEIWYRLGTEFESGDGAGSTTPGTFVTANVDLPAGYTNQAFFLKFDAISGYGPDLYLDDVTITPTTPQPMISVLPTALDFPDTPMGGSSMMQFTIQNTGTATLSGDIVTPAGYTVAAARDVSNRAALTSSAGSRNALGFSVIAGTTNTYELTFSPALPQAYTGNLVISSNAANNPAINIPVSGLGYAPPTAILSPTSIVETLAVGYQLTSGFSICNTGSVNLNYTITFTGSPSWIVCDPMIASVPNSACYPVGIQFDATGLAAGTYNTSIVFTSNDPDNPVQYLPVTLNVYQPNTPNWTVVTYPNNSATVYGIATIDWGACQQHDWVGAFVGSECRGMAEVSINEGTAYVTLLVNLASQGETVSFMVFDNTMNMSYPVEQTYALNFGQVIGTPTPIALNGITQIIIEEPVVEMETMISGEMGMQWQPCANADEYNIYRSESPYGPFVLIGTTTNPQFTDPQVFSQAFYYVTAVKNLPGRRN